jgi:acetyl-CoA carboxylase biotin carboxylase subunit
VSKLSVWAPDRRAAIQRMRRALSEYIVTGIRTNLVFHEKLLAHPEFVAGRYHTGFLAEHAAELVGYTEVPDDEQRILAAAIAIAAARNERGTARAEGEENEARSRLSPWVHQHRTRALR